MYTQDRLGEINSARNHSKIATTCFAVSLFVFTLFSHAQPARAAMNDGTRQHAILQSHQQTIPFLENLGQVKNPQVKYYTRALGATVLITEDGMISYALPDGAPDSGKGWIINERPIHGGEPRVTGVNKSPVKASYFSGQDPSQWKSRLSAYESIEFGTVFPNVSMTLQASEDNVEKIFHVQPGGRVDDIRLLLDGAQGLSVAQDGRLVVQTGLGQISFTKPVAYQENTDGTQTRVQVAYQVQDNSYGFKVGEYDPGRPLIIDPLLAQTLYGGDDWDENIYGLVTDPSGNLFVVGYTDSTDFPATPGAYSTADDPDSDDRNGFISKFDADLNLLATTYVHSAWFKDVAVDQNGNVYASGRTLSENYPTTPNAYSREYGGSENGGADGIIAKLDGDLQQLLGSTYLGGTEWWDEVGAIAVDQDGVVYVTGWEESADFPTTPGAFDRVYHEGGGDGYVAKLDSDLSILLASTTIGGNERDGGRAIVLGPDGSVYIAGRSNSADFPVTANAYDTSHNGSGDVIVTKFTNDLSSVVASTFVGGEEFDHAESLAMGADGSIYVVGRSKSSNFPTTDGALSNTMAGGFEGDAFLIRLDGKLESLLASTYVGGSDSEESFKVVVDNNGNIFMAGFTYSPDFPTTEGALSRNINGGDIAASADNRDSFVSKFDAELNLLASTYVGGPHDDRAHRMAINGKGEVYLGGETLTDAAENAATSDIFFGPKSQDSNLFVVKLNNELSDAPLPPEDTNTSEDSGPAASEGDSEDSSSEDTPNAADTTSVAQNDSNQQSLSSEDGGNGGGAFGLALMWLMLLHAFIRMRSRVA